MKTSLRAGREARKRGQRPANKLNLVALMDIFTILVFFLLVNSSDVEVLQTHNSVELPDSTSEQEPGSNLVITITEQNILVAGTAVTTISDVMALDEDTIPVLAEELRHRAARGANPQAAGIEQPRPVTIMGDRDLPYTLLKRIMTTCADNSYRDISLAVNKVPGEDADELAREG